MDNGCMVMVDSRKGNYLGSLLIWRNVRDVQSHNFKF